MAIVLWVSVFPRTCDAVEPGKISLAVLVSLKIKPYMDASEGISKSIENFGVAAELFFLEEYEGELDHLHDVIEEEGFNGLVAVGPEAARFLWSTFSTTKFPRIYTMVLHPEKVLAVSEGGLCGVPLNISPARQIDIYKTTLPALEKIGLLYDPKYNEAFGKAAMEAGRLAGVRIVPLEVHSRKEIPLILARHWKDINVLWLIPDRTVTSESLVRHIIKLSIANRVPVIGYNRFFSESGAAIALTFDYEKIGRQAGRLAMELLMENRCSSVIPAHHLILNERVLKKIGVTYATGDSSVSGSEQ